MSGIFSEGFKTERLQSDIYILGTLSPLHQAVQPEHVVVELHSWLASLIIVLNSKTLQESRLYRRMCYFSLFDDFLKSTFSPML